MLGRQRVCRLDGCDNEVEGRSRYCSMECRIEAQRASERRYEEMHREQRAQAQRDRRAAGAGPVEHEDEPLVDYTKQGSGPPQFPGIGQAPAPRRTLPDGRVPSPAERSYVSTLTASERRDRYNVEREMVRAQIAAEENDVSSWDALIAQGQRQANTVNFGQPGVDYSGMRGGRVQHPVSNPAAAGVLYGPSPEYMAAAAGRSVRGPQPPRENSGPQRIPKIIY
jgi:hypothetical protein